RQRDAVVGVAGGLVHAADLGGEALADGEAGGVVLGAVDAQARRQALDGGAEVGAVGGQVALRVERHDVGIDDRHLKVSWIRKSGVSRRLASQGLAVIRSCPLLRKVSAVSCQALALSRFFSATGG